VMFGSSVSVCIDFLSLVDGLFFLVCFGIGNCIEKPSL